MSDAEQPAGMVHAAYTEVVVIKTGDVGDHIYRRGRRYHVDAETLAALVKAGQVEPDTAAK